MKYSLVGAAIIAGTVMVAAAPVLDTGVLAPRSALYAGVPQTEERGIVHRREADASFNNDLKYSKLGGKGE